MQGFREQLGKTVNIYSLRIMDASGNVLIGATVLLSILRHSDGFWWDWGDSTFKASGWSGGGSGRTQVMTERDAVQVESQGAYYYSWAIPTGSDDEYLPFIYCAAAGNPVQQGAVVAGSWVENIDAQLSTEFSKQNALAGKNIRLFDTVYDGFGNLTSGTKRGYASKSDLEADTNHIFEITITGVYTAANKATTFDQKDSL